MLIKTINLNFTFINFCLIIFHFNYKYCLILLNYYHNLCFKYISSTNINIIIVTIIALLINVHTINKLHKGAILKDLS